MSIQHNLIADPDIHEPKGVATAASNSIYVANGSGSGVWTNFISYAGAYITFDTVSPYNFTATTSDAVVNPTLIAGPLQNFTIVSSPNARIQYDGTTNSDVDIVATFSTQQASGGSRDAEWALFKNGVEIPGTRAIRSLSTSTYGSITLIGNVSMATNDYIEIHAKASGACTIEFASLAITLNGVLA